MKSAKTLLLAATMLMFVHFTFAQAWTPSSAPSDYWLGCLASSADGTTLLAGTFPGPIVISTNSGSTWFTNTSPIGQWYGVSASADGTKLAASSFTSIYTSPDSGNTWISNKLPVIQWTSIASSADGNKLVAVASTGGGFGQHGGPIYTSTNAGTTWMPANANIEYWQSVASSADGTKLVAVVSSIYNGTPQPPGGPIYTSTNSGLTWTPSMAPSNHWHSVASSADGTKLAAVAYDGGYPTSDPIYTSTDSGANWMPTGPMNHDWYCIASSADGNTLAAITYSGFTYITTNSGATWATNFISADSTSIAATADGNKLAATSVYPANIIYTSQAIPPPSMNISPTDGGLKLSWIVPSTNFVLQQSPDLTSWTNVTNAPVLNLTNLQNQVALVPSNSSSFYRLKTP